MRNDDEPAGAGALCAGVAMLLCLAGQAAAQCVGDCDANGAVTINELIVGVAIALGNQPSSTCPAFQNAQGEVSIAQLIQGVNNALDGCPEDGLLGGPPGGRALDAVRDEFSPDAYVRPEELSGPLVRTQVELAFRKDATVDAVNALLRRIDGRIVSSREGVLILVLRIPDPGSAEALFERLGALAADPLVRAANPVLVPDPKVLPATTMGTAFVEFIRQQLAVRAHAAWNAIPALIPASPPLLVVGDKFGDGPPGDAFGVFAVPGDFGSDAPNDHGYLVLGIAAAAFDPEPVPDDVDSVAGLYPAGLAVRAVDISLFGGLTLPSPELDDRMLKLISAAPDRVVLNTSLGTNCKTLEDAAMFCSRESATEHGLSWIERVRGSDWPDDLSHDLEGKFLHATAASNVESIGRLGADVSSRWNAATLIDPLIDPKTLAVVPNLTNTLVVENFRSSSDEPFEPDCIAQSSELGGNIGAIGSPVYGFRSATSAGVLLDGGTSSATPQVAALAAYVWALRSSLSPAELVALLQRTAQVLPGCGNGLVIDAYAAVLAADEGNPARPVLHAILDVADASGNEGRNGAFDEHDLDLFLMHIDTDAGPPDYGRYELNGDGFTGFPGTPGGRKRIDLDLDGDYGLARLDVEGLPLRFDEEGLSDLKVLCYEAYSSVYAGDPDARTERLGLEACLQADLEVLFPTTVQSDVSELLSVRLVDLDLADPDTGDLLGQAGARIELTVTGGTVDDFVGTTDDDGLFQTNARLFSGQPELTIELVARAGENGPELARKTIHASGVPTSCGLPTSSVFLRLVIGNRPAENPIVLETTSPGMLTDSAQSPGFMNSATVREGFVQAAASDDDPASGVPGRPALGLGEFRDEFIINPVDPVLNGTGADITFSMRVTASMGVSGDRAAALWTLSASPFVFAGQASPHGFLSTVPVPGQTSGDLSGGTYAVTIPSSSPFARLGQPFLLDVTFSATVGVACGSDEPCPPPGLTGSGHVEGTVQWLGIQSVRTAAGNSVPFTVCSASGANWAGTP